MRIGARGGGGRSKRPRHPAVPCTGGTSLSGLLYLPATARPRCGGPPTGSVAGVCIRFSNIRATLRERYGARAAMRPPDGCAGAAHACGRRVRAHALTHRRASRPVRAHRDVARRQCCSAPHLCLDAFQRIARGAPQRAERRASSVVRRGFRRDSGRHGTALALGGPGESTAIRLQHRLLNAPGNGLLHGQRRPTHQVSRRDRVRRTPFFVWRMT